MPISSVTQPVSHPNWWAPASAASKPANPTTTTGSQNGSGPAINAGTGANPFAVMASELQSLLVQLQGGTSSAAGAGVTSAGMMPAAASAASGSTGVSHGHHHHIHGGEADPSAQDAATTLIDDLTGTGTSGSTALGAGRRGTNNGSDDLLTNFADRALADTQAT